MGQLPQISEAEYEIMKILWEEYPLSTNEICERAQQTHSWNQKTIHTLLSRLNNKRVISYEKRDVCTIIFRSSPRISIWNRRITIFLTGSMTERRRRCSPPFCPTRRLLILICRKCTT